MFYNKRSLVAAKKKKKKAGSWGGIFQKCLGKGGGGAGQGWQLCGHISKMLPPGHTSDFELHMDKYLQ